MVSTTYSAAVVVVLAQLLPLLGIEVSTEALTTTLSTIITIVAGVVIMYRRLTKGDISAFGVRK
jgi:uncharacterized membrane protein